MNKPLPTVQEISKLSDSSREILNILAIAGLGINQMDLRNILEKFAIHTQNLQLLPKNSIARHITPLKKLGLVRTSGGTYYMDQEKAWFVIKSVIGSWENMIPYVEILRFQYPVERYYYYTDRLILRREIPIAIMQKDGRKFLNLRQKLYGYAWRNNAFIDPIITYFDQPFDPEELSPFYPSFQAQITTMLLEGKGEYIENMERYLSYGISLLDESGLGKEERGNLVYALLAVLCFQGKIRQAEEILSIHGTIQPDINPMFEGWIALLRGEENVTVTAFNKASKIQKVRGYFPEIEGIIHHFALLFTKNYKKSAAYGKRKFEWVEVHKMLAAVSAFQQNEVGAADHLHNTNYHVPLYALLAGLGQIWTNQEVEKECLDSLNKQASFAEKNGHLFFALLASEVLAHGLSGNAQAVAEESIQRISTQTEIVPFLPRLQPKANWERALEGLESLAFSTASSPQNKSRLIWHVDPSYGHIQPIEQKTKKNGGWTKGRNVALKRLKEDGLSIMTEQDRQIVAALKKETYRDYYYYGKTEYVWEKAKALTAMVDHPYLFHADNPTVPIELIRKNPELIFEKKNGRYVISFSPEFSQAGVTLIKETNTRYQLLIVTEQQWAIAQMLSGKSNLFPIQAKDRLGKIIGRLASTFTVQSSLLDDTADVVSIQGLSLPHVLLMPASDGFKAEILVKPFASDPPYFRAGEGREQVIAEINGVRTMAKRSLKAEKKNYQHLLKQTAILERISPYRGEWELPDPEDCLQLLLELEPLRKSGDLIIEWPKGETLKLAGQIDFDQLQLRVKKQRNWFGVEGEVKIDDQLVLDLQSLLRLLDQEEGNAQFVSLSDGRFLSLTRTFRQRLEELSGYLQEGKKGLQLHPIVAPNLEEWDDWGAQLKADKAWKQQLNKLKEARNLRPEVPNTLQADLRSYQEEGFYWLARLAHWGVGACLADDMGLGKTLQALALMLDRAPMGPVLVVAPASVVRNWMREAQRFAPTLRPLLLTEGNRAEIIADLGPFDLLIVSYNLMVNEIEGLGLVEFQMLVLDEAQAIKNRQTKRSKAAKQIQAGFRLLTTGTPIENHLGELWNLFDFLNPGLLGSQEHFNERFAHPIERDNDPQVRKQLRRLLRPFILRRRKSEVLDELPPKTEITLNVPLSKEELAFYEALRRDALQQLAVGSADAPGENRFQILAEITKLRQACCHPRLILPEANLPASKLQLFMKVLNELLSNGHKALVFSQFVRFLKIVETEIDNTGIAYQYLDGQTPLKKREERVQAFQRGEGDVFLISLKAGGVGLNLTAADYVIHLDPWWNPAVEDQASDRAHRIGQQRPVTVYRLVTEGTIEEKIINLHAEKRDLADSLLEGGGASAKLSSEELMALIQEVPEEHPS
ncbi:MAG: DEAD/DEAH box helicase [Bacteroidota bacterium]